MNARYSDPKNEGWIMTTMQVNIPRTALMEAVEHLSMEELTTFLDDVLELKARRIAPSVTVSEEELLRMVYNLQLSETEHDRLLQLGEKLTDETISEAERAELGTLTDKSERLNAERIAAVSKLAILRHKPLREMMQQLGLWNANVASES
jgi:hypothetical protein